MKINYVPGLSLRFFPGLSRNPDDAAGDYIATGSKIVILTGDAPTESALWDLTDLEAFLALNEDKIVYRETTNLKYSYDGYQLKRIIQRLPIDSTEMIPLCDSQVQTIQGENPGEIVTANNLYALIYSPDKDNTLNTQGNDLIMLIPDVGTNPDSYLSISKTDFTQGETMYFRNLTISLFQGYQITDAPITEMQEDPEKPGSEIPVVVGSKKNVFYNKIWANRIAEAFRDCFISEQLNGTKTIKLYDPVTKLMENLNYSVTNVQDFYKLFSFPSKLYLRGGYDDVIPNTSAASFIRKVDPQTKQWLNADASNIISATHFQYGYLVNQSVLDLLDEINQRSLNGTLPSYGDLFSGVYTTTAYATPNESKYFRVGSEVERNIILETKGAIVSLLSTWLLNLSYKNVEINASFSKLLIEVMGFEESLVQRAIKSIIPFDMDITAFISTFDKESNVLTVQNMKPMKLDTRYKKSIFNPTNEGLFLLLNRNRISGYNKCELYSPALYVTGTKVGIKVSTLDTVSFPLTQTVLDGEPTDINSNRVRIKDYTAISIGLTSNGETDLEYDILDNIDYIDSFTVMVKVPNKF